jgi:hypothetical protein
MRTVDRARANRAVIDGPLEVQSDSVIYKGRVIASVAQLVETVARADVTSVERPAQGSASAGTAAVIGAVVAGVIGGVYTGTQPGPDATAAVGVLIFAPIGAGVGFLAGSRAESNSKRPVVIYRNWVG